MTDMRSNVSPHRPVDSYSCFIQRPERPGQDIRRRQPYEAGEGTGAAVGGLGRLRRVWQARGQDGIGLLG